MKALHRWRLPCMLLALILLLAGCATSSQDLRKSRDARDLGERLLRANDNTRALQQFLKALELNPNDPYLHYDLAYAYNAKGVLDKAEFHLKEAIRLKPDYADAYNYLGVLYFRTGRVDLAIESYEKALSNLLYLNPQNAHFNLGVAYLTRKEYQKAVEQFKEAIKIVPDYAAAYVNLGRAYEGLDMDRQAKRSYEEAVGYAPNTPQAHFYLGKLLERTGEKQAAAKSFEEVVRLAPESELAEEARSYLKNPK